MFAEFFEHRLPNVTQAQAGAHHAPTRAQCAKNREEDTSQGTSHPGRCAAVRSLLHCKLKRVLRATIWQHIVFSTLCFAAQLQFAIQVTAALAKRNKSVTCHSSSSYLLEESKLGLTIIEGSVGLVRKKTEAYPETQHPATVPAKAAGRSHPNHLSWSKPHFPKPSTK